MARCFSVIAAMAVVVGAEASRGVLAQDVTCRINETVVQEFAEIVFPLKLSGTRPVEVQVLGARVFKDIAWTAKVSNPRMSLGQKERRFDADVDATADGVPWKGKVTGSLAIDYDEKRRAVVVQVEKAIAPVSIGPLRFDLDVSDEVPEMPLHVDLPEFTTSFNGKKVTARTIPSIEFEDQAIIVNGDVEFTVEK